MGLLDSLLQEKNAKMAWDDDNCSSHCHW